MARDVRGYEFDWFAFDADGHLAHFSTAGSALAPAWALADPEAQDALGDWLMSQVSGSEAIVVEAGHARDWIAYAERGLFSYDSDYSGGPYRLIARPASPLIAPQLTTPRRLEVDCFAKHLRIQPAVIIGSAETAPSSS